MKTKVLLKSHKHIWLFTNKKGNRGKSQVKQYKYLGSITNDCNSIEEEVKERIAVGIKAYYANRKFFKSRIVTKISKLKLYRTVTRPSETWVLKENIIQKLLVFERKILKRNS